jgi:hypothetical protein
LITIAIVSTPVVQGPESADACSFVRFAKADPVCDRRLSVIFYRTLIDDGNIPAIMPGCR